MTLFRKSKKAQAEANRRKRLKAPRVEPVQQRGPQGSLLDTGIFALFALLAVIICFVGLSPAGPVLQVGQVARIRVVAELPFSYQSELLREDRVEAVKRTVPPVFRVDMGKFEQYEGYITDTLDKLSSYAQLPQGATNDLTALTADDVNHFLEATDEGNPYRLNASDFATFFNKLPAERRQEAIQEGLVLMRDLLETGIYNSEDGSFQAAQGRLRFFDVHDKEGRLQQVEILSLEDALRSLRINLTALDIPREVSISLFRLLRPGLQPNIVYDEARTQDRIDKAVAAIEPVQVDVREGEIIIEPNTTVTDLQKEQLEAYRKALRASRISQVGLETLLIERMIMTIIIVAGAALYLHTFHQAYADNRRFIVTAGFAILFNLGLIRLIYELGTGPLAESNPLLPSLAPFLFPVALGPILIAILVGTGPGILAAALIAVMTAMMGGNSLAMLIAALLSSLIGIYSSRRIQLRARVVRAGFLTGMAMAIFAVLVGLRDAQEPAVIVYQIIAALFTGLVTGITVVGLLPIGESIFRYTTDITLLELTDFNHPLLRKMQMEAPGSYHHSLMVANLAENAAARIGANPLLCRVCALFHDIGKLAKPEYFTENQRDGYNPHLERNPSMSALVIKSHVKEGVQLAKQNRLPKVILDVIRQHHGTSLIQYFYYKAIEQQKEAVVEDPTGRTPRIELDKVNEDTYRYEGPTPQFTESAIIMLADSIEAASRSLRKVTPQSVEELIEKIVSARIEDGQLDATPLTFRDLKKLRESFAFTLLNSLHARVEYPKETDSGGDKKKASKTRAPFPPDTDTAATAESKAAKEKTSGGGLPSQQPAPSAPRR
ncbi:MAG: 7TM receptor with intracellular metal dependent phosphohydrolase [Puniceicoccaceae bacterium 5H]|nr:MAG: 7TM receptor with intracellular metal dependent phosphohydrolase [Puniceicoccaceae bacterium 5H]